MIFRLILLIIFTSHSPLSFGEDAKKTEQTFTLEEVKSSNALLLTDSACGSCTKLIKKIPSICEKLKPQSFSVLAVGRIKKNKKKLAAYEQDFKIHYSKNRDLLIDIDTPATPALLINKKHFVVGYFSILKYLKDNKNHFCNIKTPNNNTPDYLN